MADTKHLLTSKTFWFNLIGGILSVAGSGLVPVKYSAPVMMIGNVILRMLTNTAVTLVSDNVTK